MRNAVLSTYGFIVDVGFLVMIEFCLFAFVYAFAFSGTMTANPNVKPIRVSTQGTSVNNSLLEDSVNISCLAFLCETFAFCDTYGTHTPKLGAGRGLNSEV